MPLPGEELLIDWTTEDGWQVICTAMDWSRCRFVRVARDQTASTTLLLLAECFETAGGVPKVVLADRMGSRHPDAATAPGAATPAAARRQGHGRTRRPSRLA